MKKATPAQYDTVLVRIKPDGGPLPSQLLNSESVLFQSQLSHCVVTESGLQVAQVRAIFTLPPQLATYDHPLVYIEWFNATRASADATGLYRVSPAHDRGGARSASVIPITRIERSCHLVPRFGRAVSRSWKTDKVLELCKDFYINHYLRHHDFVLFVEEILYSSTAHRKI